MRFFDVTPTGRIINTFSKDMDDIDAQLPRVAEMLTTYAVTILLTLAVVAYVIPYFLIPIVPVFLAYLLVARVSRPTLQQTKRVEHATRSPVVSQLGATIEGLTTVHAFTKESQFAARFQQLVDLNARVLLADVYSNRWLALRLEFITLTMAVMVSAWVVGLSRQLSPELAGLALLYVSTLTGLFEYTTRLGSEVEARFTAVERIMQYTQQVPVEEEHGESDSGSAQHRRFKETPALRTSSVDFTVRGEEMGRQNKSVERFERVVWQGVDFHRHLCLHSA